MNNNSIFLFLLCISINTNTTSLLLPQPHEKASDGDQKAVEAALAPLGALPCDVVVRLCTDQDNVVNYWNDIDNDLEV
jgi:hypothetical protein